MTRVDDDDQAGFAQVRDGVPIEPVTRPEKPQED